MNAEQRTRIEQHGRNLLAIFPNAAERDPVKLCKKLRRLEVQATKHTLELCNGDEPGEHGDEWQKRHDNALFIILNKVNVLLGNTTGKKGKKSTVPVFVNRDPRGYAMKIDSEWMREHGNATDHPAKSPAAVCRLHRDWGGYGLIAPEIK